MLVDVSVESASSSSCSGNANTNTNTNTKSDPIYKGMKHGKSPPAPVRSKSRPRKTMTLLNIKEITDIGGIIVSGLGKLKHMGAIAEVQAALQVGPV